MNAEPHVRYSFHVDHSRRRFRLQPGERPARPTTRIPRVSRLMALALKFNRMLDDGAVVSMAELARLGRVTRARMTQLMDLTLLAPDIQEALLFLPAAEKGHDVVTLRTMRYVCATPFWHEQRERWTEITDS
jgi:hypothetical protein